jgi:glycosidase
MPPFHRSLVVASLLLAAACRSPAPPPPDGAAAAAAAPAPRPSVTGTAGATPWWDGRVFYEIFVRSYADSTTGPLANDGTGDLQGLIERLDHLNDGNPATTTDLGITGIWLMPISPSPSYHGYDVTDYYGVNPEYGTRDDLRRLLAECHKRGIRVIVDLVLNHSSSQHPQFRKALRGDPAAQDWYIFLPGDQVPTVRGPWDQVVWHESNRLHYYGVFWGGMPDLNYRNPDVTAEAYRVADFWLRDVGVDGFRLDAVRYIIEDGAEMADTPETIQWLAGFRSHVKGVNPAALTIGEVWTSTEIVSDYIGAGALDLAFEFDLAAAILDAARSGTKDKLAYTIDNVSASYPLGRYATMITNHDQERTASALDEDPARMKLAASLLLTLPGVPFLYYGEEIGQTGEKPDEMIRNPMPWTGGRNAGFTQASQPWEPLQPGHERRNVAAQDADPDSLLNHYRRLVRLRQAEPALAVGDVRSIETGRNDVIAWERTAGQQRVTVIANLSRDEIRGYRLPQSTTRFVRELVGGSVVDPGAGLTLAPLHVSVLASE